MVAPDSNESTPKRKSSKERKKKLLDEQPETLITSVLKELTEDVADTERNDNSSNVISHNYCINNQEWILKLHSSFFYINFMSH